MNLNTEDPRDEEEEVTTRDHGNEVRPFFASHLTLLLCATLAFFGPLTLTPSSALLQS